MKQLAPGIALILLVMSPVAADAAASPSCCACVPNLLANETREPPQQALFCAEVFGQEMLDREIDRCTAFDQPDELFTLICIPKEDESVPCETLLAINDANCPGNAAAPAMSALALSALALLLVGGGLAALRRRA